MGILATFFRVFGEDRRSLDNHTPAPHRPRAGFEDLHALLVGTNEKTRKQPAQAAPALKR
ncbi:MAG: hypothetical protein DI626_07045 [Micavibrio aeruginosavorus]|uniref:Uncharacterized protein n=1 Tax=Micavibrio aeruginosavorus TaxID=349221 RepID=A0A2W5BVX5_9BACT|nr:MAG: hypothetical protein DI626_07045 [Micavibrio aeruginosavorus]